MRRHTKDELKTLAAGFAFLLMLLMGGFISITLLERGVGDGWALLFGIGIPMSIGVLSAIGSRAGGEWVSYGSMKDK